MPIAPLSEQRRIVTKLEELFSELDAGVAALKRAQARIIRYRQSLLKSAVTGDLTREWRESDRTRQLVTGYRNSQEWTGPIQIPQDWQWATLEELAKVKGGIAKGNKRNDTLPLRSVPYLRVANVQRGYLDLSEMKEIAAPESMIRDLCLQPGDVLFNEGGDRDKLGRGWIWSGEITECIHQNHVFRARISGAVIEPKWLSHYGNSVAQAYFESEGKQTTNLASISMSKLKLLPVPIPPQQEQQVILAELDRRLSAVETMESTIQAGLRRAERLRQSTLERAFRGVLVPQDPSDEPAEAMLARLQSQKSIPTPARKGRPRKSSASGGTGA